MVGANIGKAQSKLLALLHLRPSQHRHDMAEDGTSKNISNRIYSKTSVPEHPRCDSALTHGSQQARSHAAAAATDPDAEQLHASRFGRAILKHGDTSLAQVNSLTHQLLRYFNDAEQQLRGCCTDHTDVSGICIVSIGPRALLILIWVPDIQNTQRD